MSYEIDDDTLSQSRINAYRRCGHAYDLFYNQKLVPRIDRPAPALGTAVHAGIASGLRGGSERAAIQSWFDETMVELAKQFEPTPEEFSNFLVIKDEAVQIAARTLAKLAEEKWTPVVVDGVPLIEHAFNVPLIDIPTWLWFRGTVDLVAKDRSGMAWLIDWKVRGTFQQDIAEETNLQMAAYQYLLHLAGVEAAGSISYQISNDNPRPPEILKSGKAYSRAAIRTTWEVYSATLINAGFDINDYLEMKDKLSLVDWFRPSRAYRSFQEVKAVWFQIVLPSARELAFQREKPQYVRNFSPFICGGCAYRDLCLEELRGGDTEFIKQVRFRDLRKPAEKSNRLPDFIED